MDLETALGQLEHQLADARPVPLSASVMVNKEELEQIAQAIRAALPEEIRQARWVLKERDQILAQAARDAEQVVDDGKRERDRLVSETEVVREARRESQRIVERAEEDGRKIKGEAEDYVDGKLGDFEVVLQKTLSTVTRGRDRLRSRTASSEIRTDEDVTLPQGMPTQPPPESRPPAASPPSTAQSPVTDADADERRAGGARFFDHEESL